jgi:hypothetical protein
MAERRPIELVILEFTSALFAALWKSLDADAQERALKELRETARTEEDQDVRYLLEMIAGIHDGTFELPKFDFRKFLGGRDDE